MFTIHDQLFYLTVFQKKKKKIYFENGTLMKLIKDIVNMIMERFEFGSKMLIRKV